MWAFIGLYGQLCLDLSQTLSHVIVDGVQFIRLALQYSVSLYQVVKGLGDIEITVIVS